MLTDSRIRRLRARALGGFKLCLNLSINPIKLGLDAFALLAKLLHQQQARYLWTNLVVNLNHLLLNHWLMYSRRGQAPAMFTDIRASLGRYVTLLQDGERAVRF
jgi:hypothetical protein